MEEMPVLAAEIENSLSEISTTWPILPIENFLWGLAVTSLSILLRAWNGALELALKGKQRKHTPLSVSFFINIILPIH